MLIYLCEIQLAQEMEAPPHTSKGPEGSQHYRKTTVTLHMKMKVL